MIYEGEGFVSGSSPYRGPRSGALEGGPLELRGFLSGKWEEGRSETERGRDGEAPGQGLAFSTGKGGLATADPGSGE